MTCQNHNTFSHIFPPFKTRQRQLALSSAYPLRDSRASCACAICSFVTNAVKVVYTAYMQNATLETKLNRLELNFRKDTITVDNVVSHR